MDLIITYPKPYSIYLKGTIVLRHQATDVPVPCSKTVDNCALESVTLEAASALSSSVEEQVKRVENPKPFLLAGAG